MTNEDQNKYGIYANYVIISRNRKIFPVYADNNSAMKIYLESIQ